MKKLFKILLALAMIATLTACGGNSAVKEKIVGKTWFFNGGSKLTLNIITFSEKEATITQKEATGNGVIKNAENNYKYKIEEKSIIITLSDGSTLEIPYTLDGENFELGGNNYQTAEEVAEGLNGYWTYRDNSKVLGISTKSEHNVKINNNNITYEHATEAYGYPGYYYYYGPDKGTLKITDSGLSDDIDGIQAFSFNIINGKATLIRYTDVFSRGKSLPGPDGYDF